MARIDNFNNFATDVADSIRSMTGKTGKIPASQFDTEIKNIETKEDLDAELNTYNTEVTEQGVSINTIINLLQGKASGGSSSTLIEEPVDLATLNKTNISVKKDGSTATYVGWYLYKTIDITNVQQVKFTNVPCYYSPSNGLYLYGIVFYDESNNFISGIGVNEVDEDEREKLAENVVVNEYLLASTKVIPAGAKYMDVCSYTINNNTYDPTITLIKESTSGETVVIDATVYSTEERVVGKWIDNKPLYRKTLEASSTITSTSSLNDVVIDHEASNVDVIFLGDGGFVKDSSGTFHPINSANHIVF